MNLIDRYRVRKQRRAEVMKQLEAEKNVDVPLREFAYLDEVSMYSLYSSRFGAIPESQKESQGRTSQTDLTTEAQVGISGVSGKGGSKWSRTRTQQNEIVSKSNIQATFRKFIEFERSRLKLQPPRGAVPRFTQAGDRAVIDAMSGGGPNSWIVPVLNLPRGSLIELEVEVRTTKLFSINSLFKLFSNLARNSPNLVEAAFDSTQMEAVREGINEFLAGLIPLRCTARNYVMVPTPDEYLIVHRALHEQLPTELRPQAYPLIVVGLTEEKSFWKDIRRIVFSGAQFQMLARVARPGVWPDWEELKVIDLIEEVNPQIAMLLRDGMRDAVRSATRPPTSPAVPTEASSGVTEPDVDFSLRYLSVLLEALQVGEPIEIDLPESSSELSPTKTGSASYRSGLYEDVERAVEVALGRELNNDFTAEVRDRFTESIVSPNESNKPSVSRPRQSEESHEAHLEVEIIALYW